MRKILSKLFNRIIIILIDIREYYSNDPLNKYKYNIDLNFEVNEELHVLERRILINFAEKKYKNSQTKNSLSGITAGFNEVCQYSFDDIEKDFFLKNGDIFKEVRGAGYWFWKPYFILQRLKLSKSNDVIFYADSGSYFIKNINPLINKVLKDEKGVLAFKLAGKNLEKEYSKYSLLRYFNFHSDEQILNSPQVMASFIIARKTPFSIKLFNEFLEIASNKYLLDDSLDKRDYENTFFKENRHDQSIWSLLVKKYGITLLSDPTQWGEIHNESNWKDIFIFHSRNPN
jgi:hypothetical protein